VQLAIAADRNETTIQGQESSAASSAASTAATLAGQENQAEISRLSQIEQNARDAEKVSFWNPDYNKDDPNSPKVNTFDLVGGKAVDSAGNPVSTDNLTPYKAVSPNSMNATDVIGYRAKAEIDEEFDIKEEKRKAAAIKQLENEELAGKIDNTIWRSTAQRQILESPYLDQGVGYNFDALIGQYGQGPDGPAIQDLQTQLAAETVAGLVPAIAAAKLTPVSDKDMAAMKEQFVTAKTQPYGIIGFIARVNRNILSNQFDEGIAAGTHSEAQKDAYIKDLDASIIRSAGRNGYPDAEMVKNGISQGYIDYIRETDRRNQARGG
jgi:hypothetical protein